MSRHIPKIFNLLFGKLLCYLVRVTRSKSINSNSVSRKKYNGVNFTPFRRQWLRGQNTSMGIRLIELTELSDTLNDKPFFKHCILQIILHILLLFIFVLNKIFCSKNWAVSYIFLIWFGVVFGIAVLKGSVFLVLFL